MQARATVRRAVKWGGLTLTALLLAAWIGSAWCDMLWTLTPTKRQYELGFARGRLIINRITTSFGSPGVLLQHAHPAINWRFHWYFDGSSVATVWIPLWFPSTLGGAITFLAWRSDGRDRRRRRLGQCSSCGYDLTGNIAGACPECGRSVVTLRK